MNNDMLKGNWNQLKGSVKETFGNLTDNDMLQMEGSLDRATGILQERYGYSKEQAQQEWDKFVSKSNRTANTKLEQANERGSGILKGVADTVKNAVDTAKEKLGA